MPRRVGDQMYIKGTAKRVKEKKTEKNWGGKHEKVNILYIEIGQLEASQGGVSVQKMLG